ncbi:(2Fe-2S)-binding protein [Salicibibacter cibarius]|uniref:(2Fe-2S)-binding protein n=1 Tax=Salicibibacter cibarius TaxID=2743000 RepID=A0A7T6Z0Y6_9BACI|nr:2Fe-2S iron-sulfur cluster-binding protein [Salicibibacter cibarius]QQK74637.1 (2Fe-2S)-binding protein [Salicibibacter cibarius]
MPTVHVDGKHSFEVEEGKKLVLALEDNGIDILHRCGGNAKCTTCRCEVLEGELGPKGEAEAAILNDKGITDPKIRLSCQNRVYSDLTVKPVKTATTTDLDPGKRPED